MTRRARRPRFFRLLRGLWAAIAAAALVQELRKPAPERHWHGTVLGVPYDFRPPTPRRARERLWAPGNPRVVGPQVFGIGWSLNLGRVVQLLRSRRR
jgi:hypothetical protein